MALHGSQEMFLVAEIARLEKELEETKFRLASESKPAATPHHFGQFLIPSTSIPPQDLHPLLLLSDSALPLGSFAFSSGLESFIAHQPKHKRNSEAFLHFLDVSLHSLASTTLPYVLSALNHPESIELLDNNLDASLSCTVARRASIAQGRALLGIWERSFRAHIIGDSPARSILEFFVETLRVDTPNEDVFACGTTLKGHLPPIFGAVSTVLRIPAQHALYIYLLNHAKTLLSAAVRASIFGPYQAQSILVSNRLMEKIASLVREEIKNPRSTEFAGQNNPMLDLWGGRHEIIYSRIFNS